MRLVPTLGLGPRRLVRRPVETLLLVLAVALGTVATITAFDALSGILQDLDQTARDPWVRMVQVWDQDNEKWTAVMSDQRYQETARRFDHAADYSPWVDRIVSQLPGLELAYFDYGASARVRVKGTDPWTATSASFCAQPSLFHLPSVALVAGRVPTREEFDRGDQGVVIGVHLLAQLYPDLTPAQALGQELEVNRNFWESGTQRGRILGVCQKAEGSSPEVWGDPGDWLAVGRRAQEDWGRASFLARSVGEVPALVARLKALVAQDPSVRSMAVGDNYAAYEQKRVLSFFAAVLALGMGAGSLLISLWTLGSVFRARVPALQRSRSLLRALGANRATLLAMDLSEILPVSVGGLVLGAAVGLGIRGGLLGKAAFAPQDPVLVAALVALVVGLPFLQLRRRGTAPSPFGAPLRLAATIGFLTLGLSGSYMALSLAQDIGRTLPKLEAPLPLWAGLVQTQQGENHMTDEAHPITARDLAEVERVLAPDLWTPLVSRNGQVPLTTVVVPSLDNRRYWIRNKVLARPAVLSAFGLPVVAGRAPFNEEQGPKALVSEEVAETLFGSSPAALGKTVADGEPGGASYEITGVFGSPSGPQSDFGAPDLVLVPAADFWTSKLTAADGAVLVFDPHRLTGSQVADRVLPILKAAHPGASPESWSGGMRQSVPVQWSQGLKAGVQSTLTVVILLAGLFLIVSCLGVLADLFVRITSRAQAIAVERALGRPFQYFVGRSFLRGASLVLGASALGAAVAAWALPALTSSLAPFLGGILARSTGRVDLAPGALVLVTLGAALLSGAIAVIPLLPYRKGPLSAQIRGEL